MVGGRDTRYLILLFANNTALPSFPLPVLLFQKRGAPHPAPPGQREDVQHCPVIRPLWILQMHIFIRVVGSPRALTTVIDPKWN